MKRYAKTIVSLWLVSAASGLNNSLGTTPQMGWNNWNIFQRSATAETMVEMADTIKASGLQSLGYQYIVMDDAWSAGRENGELKPLAEKFPNGVSALASELHGMGFKWGMYSDAGLTTCAGYEGSEGFEIQDARTFAEWGVDYLKYDNCNHDSKPQRIRYAAMRDALLDVGRPICFAMCSWGEDDVWEWGAGMANSWRISGDIFPAWWDIVRTVDRMQTISKYGSPGGWNDMDMLQVGNGDLTDDEQVAHFSLWAALKSPLMMGNDLRVANEDVFSILGNKAVIAISQDPLGIPATFKKLFEKSNAQLWSGPLNGGDYVALIFNPGDRPATIKATAADIFDGNRSLIEHTWATYDLWEDRYKSNADILGCLTSHYLSRDRPIYSYVAKHSISMFRLRKDFLESKDSNRDLDIVIQDL